MYINDEEEHQSSCEEPGNRCQPTFFDATFSPGGHKVVLSYASFDESALAELSWELLQSFQCLSLNTTSEDGYKQLHTSLDDATIIFQIKSGGHAHIAFARDQGSAMAGRLSYEITLGDQSNSQTTIRQVSEGDDNVRTLMTVETTGILHSYQELPFWASVRNGLVRVGRGNTVGRAVIAEWEDPDPQPVNSIGVSTSGGYTGQWHICHDTSCRSDEWRQDLFQNADFTNLISSTCVRHEASGFLDVCGNTEDAAASISHLEITTANRADTAEECVTTGKVFVASSDLELVFDTEKTSGGYCHDEQLVAVRLRGVDISNGAAGTIISSARLRFIVDESGSASSEPVRFRVQGEAIGHSPGFSGADHEISSRSRTRTSVEWQADVHDNVGDTTETPDLSHVIQEIVTQPDWEFGGSLTIIISWIFDSGTGVRWVKADTATLILDYTEPSHGSYPGCWCPVGDGLLPNKAACEAWSATLTSTITVAETSLYRFKQESSTSSSVTVEIDGAVMHTSGCEEVNGECYEQLFDAALPTGAHEVVVRFAEYEGFGQLALAWESISLPRMRECYSDARGVDYRGRVAVTANGIGCADWTS